MIGDVLQPTHLIFILVVALLVLGPKRLPEVGRSLGKGIRDFRGALSGADEPRSPSAEADSSVQSGITPVTPATTSMPAEDTAAEHETVTTVAVPFGEATEDAGDPVPSGSVSPHTVEGSAVEHDETDSTASEPVSTPAEPHPVAPAGDRPTSQA